MAIPILHFWQKYFENIDEGLGSTYERFIINDVLFKAVDHYRIKSAIETPSFGFTGLSGINSMGLAMKKVDMTITDSDPKRLELIKKVWSETDFKVNFDLIKNYEILPYDDNSFDMAWNFSALWFVPDLQKFLMELSRISKKIILIMVPNRTGLGYLHQKFYGKEDLKRFLKEENIIPKNFIQPLENMGWKLMHDSLIDCPLWPDIGMSKEEFLNKAFAPFITFSPRTSMPPTSPPTFMGGAGGGTRTDAFMLSDTSYLPPHSQEGKVGGLSILNHYSGKDLTLKNKVMKYNHFEKHAPNIFKKLWSHHHYYLFLKKKQCNASFASLSKGGRGDVTL